MGKMNELTIEIQEMVANGCSCDYISRRLGLPESTVREYVIHSGINCIRMDKEAKNDDK